MFDSDIPFEPTRIQAAAMYCSDGRFGDQMDDFLHNALSLPRYDRLAVPGGPACLAGLFQTYREEEAAAAQLRFLIEVHGLGRVVLIAHGGCAFYSDRLRIDPLDLRQRQEEDLAKAVRRVQSMAAQLVVDSFFAERHDARIRFVPCT